MFRNNRLSSHIQTGGGDKKKENRNKGGDPDYEEIGPQRHKQDTCEGRVDGRLCELCGSIEAAVRCEKCNDQAFCFSCDDMYHRHPKRSSHARKTLESKLKREKPARPPLPPKGSDGPSISPPQPPPRRNKRPSLPSSLPGQNEERIPSLRYSYAPSGDRYSIVWRASKSTENETGKSLMGSLRRIMGGRPLPLPPDPNKGENKRKIEAPDTTFPRSQTAPSTLADEKSTQQSLAVAIPQSIIELNRKTIAKPPASMPPIPTSTHVQYPSLQPKIQEPPRGRKFSLQQFPPSLEDKRASMLEAQTPSNSWEKQPGGVVIPPKGRSQSMTPEQWNQVIAMQGNNTAVPGCCVTTPSSNLTGIASSRPGFNASSGGGRPGNIGRGMVSSASVCDLNSLDQQNQHPYPNMSSANSFQQLSLMSYDGGNMMWMPCALCQPPPMFQAPVNSVGMKRTTSNISMNLSSVGSDFTGYPWAPNPHMHHHMPPLYPGYYPGFHQHMVPPMSMQGSAMSIPESMRSFNRMPPSPVPSMRSMSHRSHKSSKSRSFSGAEMGGRKSRNRSRKRSEESEDSASSSMSDHGREQIPSLRPSKTGLAWQCDHCTFINPGHVHSCGMCSKTPGKPFEKEHHSRRGSDKRKHNNKRDVKTDHKENVSDYDNDTGIKKNGRHSRNDHRLKPSGSLKSSGKSVKSHRRESLSRSPSLSVSDDDEERRLEKQLKDLRVTSRSKAGDYDRLSVTSRTKEQGSLKREGGGSRYKNKRRFHSERSRTPGRSSPLKTSRRASVEYDERGSSQYTSSSEENIPAQQKSSQEGTLIDTTTSDSKTVKVAKSDDEKDYAQCLRNKSAVSSEYTSDSSESKSPEEIHPGTNCTDDEGSEQYPDEVFEKEQPATPEVAKKPEIEIYEAKVTDVKFETEEIMVYPDNNLYVPGTYKSSKGEIEEPPSFANTLDGIETLKSHEVADIDPNSQALDDQIDIADFPLPDMDDIIPVLNYNEPKEESDHDVPKELSEGNETSGKQKFYEADDDNKDTNTIKQNKNSNIARAMQPERKVEEPSYETIEEPKGDDDDDDNKYEPENFPKVDNTEALPDEAAQAVTPESKKSTSTDSESEAEEKISMHEEEESPEDIPDQVQEPEKLSRSSSPDSVDVVLLDQPYSPLSMSSSEALFYSPPDSPEVGLNDKLRRKTNQHFEDAEESDGQKQKVERPSSVATGYDDVTLNFQDTPVQPDTFSPIRRSTSEQILSSRSQKRDTEVQNETVLNPTLKEKSKRIPSLLMTEDEDEVDERSMTVKEIIERRKQKTMKQQGLELVQILREAEDRGYNPEDVSVALSMSSDKDPLEWLEENWAHMIDTVITLASDYGREKNINDIGEISAVEAKKALRMHKGSIWASVTECVEQRQKKFKELYSQGRFKREDVIKSLEAHEGDSEGAYLELIRTRQVNSSSFFKKIWAPAEEAMNSVSSLFRRDSKAKQAVLTEEAPAVDEGAEPLGEPRDKSQKEMNEGEDEYANADHNPALEKKTVEGGGVYANVVAPLLQKIENSLQRSAERVPAISEELKRKIVQAILEADPDSAKDNFTFDSDDESTIEELLAVAENPSFYEYFTAVDLEEDYEESSAPFKEGEEDKEDSEEESNSKESANAGSDVDETDHQEGEEVPSDFEFKDEYSSFSDPEPENPLFVKGSDQNIRESEVGVGPLRSSNLTIGSSAAGNSTSKLDKLEKADNLLSSSFSSYRDAAEDPSTTTLSKKYELPMASGNENESLQLKNKSKQPDATVPSLIPAKSQAIEQKDVEKIKLERETDVTEKQNKSATIKKSAEIKRGPLTTVRKRDPSPTRQYSRNNEGKGYLDTVRGSREGKISSKDSQENGERNMQRACDENAKQKIDEVESEDEESVSVTTGRISLSLTKTGDKPASIDVKSQTIITDVAVIPNQPEELSEARISDALYPKKGSAASAENHDKNEVQASDEVRSEPDVEEQQEIQFPQLDVDEAAKVRAHGGPITVQKASLIVGKAIAKAMARESSVRKDSHSSENISQTGTPTPPRLTPEPEDPSGDQPTGVPSDSEDELLRSLETIPEEEEKSARTESGRIITRSAGTDSDSTKDSTTKSLTIPPAVASFSGPLFIPSAASDQTMSSTYHNISAPREGLQSARTSRDRIDKSVNLSSSNDGKNVFLELKAKLSSPFKTASNASLKPSPTGGPLTTDQSRSNRTLKDNGEKSTAMSSTDQNSRGPSDNKDEKVTSSSRPSKSIATAASDNVVTDRTKELSSSSKPVLKESSSNKPLVTKDTENDVKIRLKETPNKKTQSEEYSQADAAKKTQSEIKKSEVNRLDSSGTQPPSSSVKHETEAKRSSTSSSTSYSANKPSTSLISTRKMHIRGRSTIDSSGESEDEEKMASAVQRIEALNNRQDKTQEYERVQVIEEQLQLETQNDIKEWDSDTSETRLEERIPIVVLPESPATQEEEEEEEEDERAVEEDQEDEEEVAEEEDESELVSITTADREEYDKLKFDRTVRRLLAEGQATTYEKAEIAAQLLTLSFDETDSIQAAEGCSSIYTALQFLQQECELCAGKYPMGKMVSLLHCVHRCCYECANNYFSFQIKTKNIRELRCPFCSEPDLDNFEETAAEYLNNMDILLKNIIDKETHELFQRKLRDWTLMKDPNFRWCNKCSSGFIANPRARKLICPDCKDITCALCRRQWELQHEGISCDDYAKWKEENEPETQAEGVAKHLAECGITCPKCRFTYALAKGGCMHFTCTECKFDFCSGCNKPFRQGAKCTVGPYCERLGLHAHHPRNCLFYLRDKEPEQLQRLLKEHDIEFDIETPHRSDVTKGNPICRVLEQKETVEGLRDDICGRPAQLGYAGLCRLHYTEYLVEIINNHGLDPVTIFDEADLRVCLRRNGKSVPVRRWESEKLYRDKLIKLIKDQLPLI